MIFNPDILDTEENFLGLEPQFSSWDTSSFVIIPVPLERTTSYGKGTARGPEKILEASRQVEFYDEVLDEIPAERGIATLKAIKFNDGDDSGRMLSCIADCVHSVAGAGKLPIILGGEHTITAGCVKGLIEAEKPFSVLQFDAHSDLRESYEDDPHSHASVMRRVWDMNVPAVHLGIRSQCREESLFIKEKNIPVFYAHTLAAMNSWNPAMELLRDDVYITIDADFFDPSIMPAVGTPEPGGFFWRETLSFLAELASRKNIIGFDFVELAPNPACAHADFTAARFIYKLIGVIGNVRPDKFPFIR